MNQYLKANYHTHTVRCQHAVGSEREYIEAAIAAGIEELGFSDHVPCPFRDGFVSGIRMRMDEAEDYVATIRRLAEEYADQIRLYVGFETEYLPEYFKEQVAFFDSLGIDYMIMGQHFVVSEEKGPYMGTPTQDEKILTSYVDCVIEGMKTGRFAYLAHPDLVNFRGDRSVYRREMTRLCMALKELDIPLEINLLGFMSNRHYPNEEFWRIAGEVGNAVICGIDIHRTDQIGDRDSYGRALALVDKYSLRLLNRLEL